MFRITRAGFTAVEMLVVIGIFTVITGVVMANLPQFREKTLLDLTAQQMATIIRQAQVYGLGTRSAGVNYPSHGVYFDIALSGGDKKSMTLFADADEGNDFDAPCPSSVECVEKYTMQGAVEISNIIGCSDSSCSSPASKDKLNIVFDRPNPEAFFFDDVVDLPPGLGYSHVKICIHSTRDTLAYREIRVSATGQIYARNNTPSCP